MLYIQEHLKPLLKMNRQHKRVAQTFPGVLSIFFPLHLLSLTSGCFLWASVWDDCEPSSPMHLKEAGEM